jgi:transcriptional regulator with AAA-type ATPase domain/NAD-dependent dihydropyrimidine dehydrogenase PreA subunit
MSASQIQWLREHTLLREWSDAAIATLAQAIHIETIQPNYRLILEDTEPTQFYILKSGVLEAYRTSPNSVAEGMVSLLPGSILFLKELLLGQPVVQTVVTLQTSELWRVDREIVLAIAQQYPEVNRSISRQLAADLDQVSAQLRYEQDRQTALRPFIVPRMKQGIVGASRYATRLRQEIKKAQNDRQSVLIFGEPGLGKDNIAALIHFGSGDRKHPLIKLNCDTIQPTGVELFGRRNRPGLLEWLGEGSLMLNNLQDLPQNLQEKLVQVLKTGEYTPVAREGEAEAMVRRSRARILMTSESAVLDCQKESIHTIKVPPVRVAKADIAAQVNYYIGLYCRSRGLLQPSVSPEAIRSLQSYDFPGNLTELEGLVERAIAQAGGTETLSEEVFWGVSPKGKRFRVNLLNLYPQLRSFLKSDWYPDRINYWITLPIFTFVVIMGFIGPQSRDQSFVLNLFWAWWWMVFLFLFPFLGRIWCSFCPFMIYGEWLQKLSLKWFPRQLLPWQRQEADRWGGWFIFGMFTLILLWEELWQLNNTAYLSSCLLLLITAGAVIFSQLFERRFWCRYLCPIGGMNGMFGKLAMIELRAQQGICGATCNTYQCYKGGAALGEGQETNGCPVYSHPAQLQDNRDCVLCMTCLKACPHRSVELNLRPPGIELWTTHKATASEVCLLFLLFGAVFMHHLGDVERLLGWNLHLDRFAVHAAVSVLALLFPGAIALSFYYLSRLFQGNRTKPFVELAYGWLPLVLGGNLAHYWQLGLSEAGRIIPVTLATFNLSQTGAPELIADPAVIDFLQGTTLMLTSVLSIILMQKIARQSFSKLWAQHGVTVGVTGLMWWMIIR